MIGERLKELRKKNGYTQVTLADNLGVSKGTVAMWETDKRMPDFDKLNELCDLFDVRLDYLTGRSDDASSPKLSENDVISIKACMNVDKDGFHKEVAKLTFSNGSKIYADIRGDANTTAMYDVLAVLCQLKPKSKNIYKLTDIEEVVDNA